MEAFLAGIAGELADDEGGRDCAVPYGRGQPQNVFPLRSDQLWIELIADEWSEHWMVALLSWHIEPIVGEIADAGRETRTRQVAECKDGIGETRRIGVTVLKSQIGLMVEQAIENMRCITGIRGDDL